MAVFIVLLTTKLSCLQKNDFGHTIAQLRKHFKQYKTYINKHLLGFFMFQVTLDISFSCSRFFPAIFFKEMFPFNLMQVVFYCTGSNNGSVS